MLEEEVEEEVVLVMLVGKWEGREVIVVRGISGDDWKAGMWVDVLVEA